MLEQDTHLQTEMADPPQLTSSPRFVFVDGLRGIAAVAVVLFHFDLVARDRPGYALWPASLHWLLQHGNLGVEIFFVISGFVISHSLRNICATWSFIGSFALRRSLRLDPPYWATILLVSLSFLLTTKLLAHRPFPLDARQVLANVFYLQYILHYPSIVVVFWTLCLEIQFYLFYVLLLHFTQAPDAKGVPVSAAYIAGFLGIASLGCNLSGYAFEGWFFNYWYMFAGGVLAYWAWNQTLPTALYATFIVAVILFSLKRHDPMSMVVAITSLTIFFAAKRQRLTVWLGGSLWQFLGKISYSLYLTHAVFDGVLFKYADRVAGESALASVGCFLAVIAASMALAIAMYLFVERPSHWLSSRVALAKKTFPT